MTDKLDGTGRVYDLLSDEESSGVRQSPWVAQQRTGSARWGGDLRARLDGRWGEVGAAVLARFDRLTRDDHAAVFEAALGKLARLPPGTHLGDARFAHAVLCEAILLDQRRWIEQIKVSPAVVARALDLAKRRVEALTGREARVFLAVCALEDVADDDEAGQVVLRAAVAYQMRWNTAHQNLSRAWRKICEGSPLATWCKDWRTGHHFVCGLPSFELWEAARGYMDACSGKAGRGGDAFDAWVKAHEAHNAWFSEWKKQSARASRRWRDFASCLDASGIAPGAVHAPLVAGCSALGIDGRVVPAKLREQSWSALLDATHRPGATARAAWLVFLREHGFGPAPEIAFRALERDATLADVACTALERAYARLLSTAEGNGGVSRTARDALCALIEGGAHG